MKNTQYLKNKWNNETMITKFSCKGVFRRNPKLTRSECNATINKSWWASSAKAKTRLCGCAPTEFSKRTYRISDVIFYLPILIKAIKTRSTIEPTHTVTSYMYLHPQSSKNIKLSQPGKLVLRISEVRKNQYSVYTQSGLS